MTYRVTPIAVAVHVDGESPIFGEQTIGVWIDDEAAGPYIVLKQLGTDDPKLGEIGLDLEQLVIITNVAKKLITAQPKEKEREPGETR